MNEVTDPNLLAQLNGGNEVTDPSVLAQLNAPAAYPNSKSFDSTSAGLLPTGSAQAQAQYSPVANNSFGQNALEGAGKAYTDMGLGAQQIYADATQSFDGGSLRAQLFQQAAAKRALDAPLQGTVGGKVGEIGAIAPAAFIPGAATWAGATALGGATGALQPVTEGDSRTVNTGIGAGLGVAGKFTGDALSNWITQRAAQPFMGWSQGSVNQAASQAVGSSASKLDQGALAETSSRLGTIFQTARSPNVSTALGGQTAQALTDAASSLNQSSRAALTSSQPVTDLMSLMRNGMATAQDLGTLSSRLGTEAAGQMGSKMGDRALGKALFQLQDHVDDLVGSTITDPDLAAAYQAARPQYRQYLTLSGRPAILNSATGDVNATALGNYLQRADRNGYTLGNNDSPLYQAARWGQATGQGKGAPEINSLPGIAKWLGYQAMNNPVSRAVGGVVSNVGKPVAPAISGGFPTLGYGSTPVLLPLWEQ